MGVICNMNPRCIYYHFYLSTIFAVSVTYLVKLGSEYTMSLFFTQTKQVDAGTILK